MKRTKSVFMLALLMSMVGIRANAHDIAVQNGDGVTIYYYIDQYRPEVSVTYYGNDLNSSKKYEGDVVIPASITYSGNTYTVTKIAGGAFYNCTNLNSVTIPNSITTIMGSAFYGCTGMSSIEIPNNVTTIGDHAFSGCTGLTSIQLPNGLRIIEEYTFNKCSSLSSIEIPNSVTTISQRAFSSCKGLTSIVIPSGVTYIGDGAFNTQSQTLTSVTVNMQTPVNISSSTFYTYSNLTLYVPYGSKAAYEAADNWKTFSKIFEGTKISMSANGICTYANANDLDLSNVSGLTAYIVSSFNPSLGTLTLTPVTEVPAGEGLLLKGAEGDYEVPFTTTTASYTNLLTGVTTPTNISPTNGDETNFILASGKHGIGFYTLSESGILAAGKAYLHLPTSDVSSSRPLTLVYENEPSGIEGISEMEEADRQYFDLQGRRIAQPTKGLYVVNGKKVIIK